MTRENIDGIHQYCDRWCERCMFTSRCAVYEHESDASPGERDMTNQAFWQRIGENFDKAQELLRKAAEEQGIDLDAISSEKEEESRTWSALHAGARKHPLALLSLAYSKLGRDWLKTQPGMLDHLEALKSNLELGVESESGALKQTAMIRDSITVIQWYLVFIHVKLSRALTGKATAVEWGDEDSPRDCDGSAKIALIAIDRSVNAWAALFELLPEHEDQFLKTLSMLQRIKLMTIEEFPGALSFVRPGFDTPSPSSMAL